MRQDIGRYVSNCKTCLSVKLSNQKPAGLMLSPEPPDKPWQNIALDIFGPLPRSSKGYSYVLVVLDLFSKFTLLYLLRQATTSVIVKILENDVFLTYGVPEILRCDNGSQFTSYQFRKLLTQYRTEIVYNPHYHPQANPTERTNRTMKAMIKATILDQSSADHKQWDKDLGKIGCALRTARSDTTGYTPLYLNFGREIVLKGTNHKKLVFD